MPSRSAVYAQARKHAEAEKAFADALAKRVAAEREALLRRRNAEDILPQQVWLQILGQIDDCNFLWSSCHNVCKTFRRSVETIFAEDHIRNSKTLITFDVGEEISGEKKHSLGLELAFDRFSNDESRVYFKESKAVPRQFGVLKASWEQWKDVLEKEHLDERADNPPFTIAVRRFVNDTELPGLRIDHEEREISFDWRGMYTCFFREEDWVERQEALWARDHLALSPASRQRISAKDMDEVAAMTLLFDKLEDVYNSARQNIRRHRIRKGSKRTKGLDWNHDRCVNEAKKLRQMREARAMASFLEFSDDEYAGSLLGSSRNSPITIDLTSSRQCIVPEAVAVIS